MYQETIQSSVSEQDLSVIQEATKYHEASKENSIKFSIIFRFVLLAVFATFGFICFLLKKQTFLALVIAPFLMYFCFAVALHLFLKIVWLLYDSLFSPPIPQKSFIRTLLKKEFRLISSTLICFLFSQYIGIDIVPENTKTSGGAPPTAEYKLYKYFSIDYAKMDEYFSNIYMGIGLSTGIFLLKNILIYALSYNVHYSYYYERIKENARMGAVIKKLNSIIGAHSSDTKEQICKRLIQVICKNGKQASYEEVCRAVSKEDGTKLFEFLEKSQTDGFVDYSDLIFFYDKTASEQQKISDGLSQKNSSVEELNFVATFICVALSVSAIISHLHTGGESKNQLLVGLTGLATSGYIFSDIIKNFLGSMTFVFFVRPFENGDHILIGGEHCQVLKINILTTIIANNKLHTTYPNNKLLGMEITNLRVSKSYEIGHTFVFDAEDYKSRREELKRRLSQHAQKHPDVFKKEIYTRNPRVIEHRKVSVEIVAVLNIMRIGIDQVRVNQENFILDLHSILKEIELIK